MSETLWAVKSNYSYLKLDGKPSFPKEGEWMTAESDFHLRGGWGGAGMSAWQDPGADVRAGMRFRLMSRGDASFPSLWEVRGE